MKFYKAYKLELEPNNKQKTLINKGIGVSRFSYNWGLNLVQETYAKSKKVLSAYDLSNLLTPYKQSEFSWMYEVSKGIPQQAFIDLEKAFKKFFNNCENPNIKEKGFPKYKRKKDCESFRLSEKIYLKDNNRYLQLPKLGKIKLKEVNYIPPNLKIRRATLSKKANKYFVSVLVEENIRKFKKKDNSVGIDLGITNLATLSDGTVFENPKALKRHNKKIKELQKELAKRQIGGSNRKKTLLKLQKMHQRVSNIRKDNIHKITTSITKKYGTIYMEDLDVEKMLKTHHLAESLSDAGFGEFMRQMEYKCEWYGRKLIKADQYFPSSKKCSGCGHIKKELSPFDKVYKCDKCNLEIGRDLNAAINLQQLADGFADSHKRLRKK